jgi:hypothetical protein
MSKNAFIFTIMGFAIVSGLFHPLMPAVVIFALQLMGDIFFGFLPLVFLFSSLMFATGCLILAGIPAALFERLTGRSETDEASYWIWLVGMALIALPAFGNFFAFGF